MFFREPPLTIYFGAAEDALNPAQYLQIADQPTQTTAPFSHIAQTLALDGLCFLRQEHGVEGMEIKDVWPQLRPFAHGGDFLITKVRHIGLGIMTADCLPVVVFDPEHNAIGIAHAGWRGSVQEINKVMLEAMRQAYGTRAEMAQVFFGPSAKSCCYVVDEQFKKHFIQYSYGAGLFSERNNNLYFDLPAFNVWQLVELGVQKEQINLHNNHCTICSIGYCSYRVQKENACRQMTVVSLS